MFLLYFLFIRYVIKSEVGIKDKTETNGKYRYLDLRHTVALGVNP